MAVSPRLALEHVELDHEPCIFRISATRGKFKGYLCGHAFSSTIVRIINGATVLNLCAHNLSLGVTWGGSHFCLVVCKARNGKNCNMEH